MKRKLFMAAMMAVGTALAGCTSDESVSAMHEDAISFNIVNGGGTRATPTTSSNYLSQVSNLHRVVRNPGLDDSRRRLGGLGLFLEQRKDVLAANDGSAELSGGDSRL